MDDFFKQQVVDLTQKAKSRSVKKPKINSQQKNEFCCIVGKNKKFKISQGYGNPSAKILFLVEHFNNEVYEFIKYLDIDLNLKDKYYLYPALECVLKDGAQLNDAIFPFIACSKQHVNNIIKRLKPKYIFTFGKSVYTITKDKKINSASLGYNRIFSYEYMCYVYPCAPLKFFLNTFGDSLVIEDNWYLYKVKNHIKEALTNNLCYPSDKELEVENIFVDTTQKCYEVLFKVIKSKEKFFVYDIETTGLNYLENEIVSIQLALNERKAYFIPFKLVDERCKQYLNTLFKTKNSIAHNGKFDCKLLIKDGIISADVKFDTMLAHHIFNPDLNHRLKTICWKYTFFGGYDYKLEEFKQENKIKEDYSKINEKILCDYGCMDVRVTYIIYKYFKNLFEKKENEKLKWIFENISTPLTEVFLTCETKGILVNISYLRKYTEKIKTEIILCKQKIYSIIGDSTINLDSNKQLLPFIKKLNLPQVKHTKKGNFSLDSDTFSEWARMGFEIGKQLSRYSELNTLLTTFLGEENIQKDGRIHATFNIHGTATGRSSASFPNFQNQPKERDFRKIYCVPKGYSFVEADFSQAELRISAIFSNDKNLKEAFQSGKDIHCATLCTLENLDYNEVYRLYKLGDDKIIKKRKGTKTVNFGVIYGESEYSLAPDLGITVEEAKRFLDEYFNSFPGLKLWRERTKQFTKTYCYTETLFGRKRFFPELEYSKNLSPRKRGEYERQSMNTPVQGSASDYALLALIAVYKYLKQNNFKSSLLGVVHDSIVIEALNDELDIIIPNIKHIMENVYDLGIKMIADIEISNIWGFKNKEEE